MAPVYLAVSYPCWKRRCAVLSLNSHETWSGELQSCASQPLATSPTQTLISHFDGSSARKTFLSGQEYDGTKCKEPKRLCPNGIELVDENTIDIEAQSAHFLIKLDGQFWGGTGGENLKGCKSQGYFLIPKGTGKYKNEGGGNWWYGIARYRFDKLCDPTKCLPDCAEEEKKEAQEVRLKLEKEGKSPPALSP
ncbi:hypothetical protein B0T21DRAFT_344728 [Apiosordaria backusii]|uniref:Uncharacterized protein n=1 Tax=Apiosordaria backusii TaxID=314023 RepID=A0AA40K3G8_9PEZI|nr:hypothetical protein B0T21DRAFT_344728 [Apiosordaria backusii]